METSLKIRLYSNNSESDALNERVLRSDAYEVK